MVKETVNCIEAPQKLKKKWTPLSHFEVRYSQGGDGNPHPSSRREQRDGSARERSRWIDAAIASRLSFFFFFLYC